MCLIFGSVGRVLKLLPDSLATVEICGRHQEVSLKILDGSVQVGDHVIVQGGYAREVVTHADAVELIGILERAFMGTDEALVMEAM